MRVLVTGAKGFIGSHVVDALLSAGHEVTGYDDSSSGHNELPCSCYAHHDVSDMASLMWACERARPECIVHLAAQPSLIASLDDPLHDGMTNVIGTITVLQVATTHQAGVVVASTGALYDSLRDVPYHEGDPLYPTSPYGISKMAAEHYVREWAQRTSLPGCILRLGNVYGPRQVPVGENQLIPRAIAGLLGEAPFAIYGDGTHRRDYVYVGDVARAFVMAVEQRASRTFNIATGVGTSTNAIVDRLAELLDQRGCLVHRDAEKPWEHASIVLSPFLAKKKLGWEATVGLDEGLRMTLEARGVAANV